MNSCEYATTISAMACALTKCLTKDEVAILAAALGQLASTLATMIVINEANEKEQEVSVIGPII